MIPTHQIVGLGGNLTLSEVYAREFVAEPHIEIYNTEPLITSAPVHPYNPMQMWAPTAKETQSPSKPTIISLEHDERSDVETSWTAWRSASGPNQVTGSRRLHHVKVLMAGYDPAATGAPVRL